MTSPKQSHGPSGCTVAAIQGAQSFGQLPSLVVAPFGQALGGDRNRNDPLARFEEAWQQWVSQHQLGQRMCQCRFLAELEAGDELIPRVGVVNSGQTGINHRRLFFGQAGTAAQVRPMHGAGTGLAARPWSSKARCACVAHRLRRPARTNLASAGQGLRKRSQSGQEGHRRPIYWLWVMGFDCCGPRASSVSAPELTVSGASGVFSLA